MELRHSGYMIVIPNYLINNPHKLISLDTSAEKYEAAESSISEDIVIIKKTFEESGIDEIEAVTGIDGDVTLTPGVSGEEAKAVIEELRDRLSEGNRTLPGSYIYSSDLLSIPRILQSIGCVAANIFRGDKTDAVMTVAAKGVPLANAVANILNISFVIVRRDLKATEGSTVSINCASGSSDRIEKTFLPKRSLKPNSRVLTVDDLLEGGRIISGMIGLLKEFGSTLVGVVVFAGNAQEKRDRMAYKSPLEVLETDVKDNHVRVEIGNIFD